MSGASLPGSFLDYKGSLPPSANKSNRLPFVPMTKDELPGSRPGARRSLHSARSRRPRVPMRAGATNWDLFLLSQSLLVPCQAVLICQEQRFENQSWLQNLLARRP